MAKASGGTRRRVASTQYKSAEESYEALVGQTGEVWNTLDKEQKKYLVDYTGSLYSDVNMDLKDDYYSVSPFKTGIDNITSAIEKSSYDRDITLVRGAYNERSVFGFSLRGAELETLQTLVGKTYKMKQFGSFSADINGGFNRPVKIVLNAPKGTKMIYAEPFSSHGAEPKGYTSKMYENWDGKKQNVDIHGENEMILQRGTSYRVDRVEKRGEKSIIYATIVKQDKH